MSKRRRGRNSVGKNVSPLELAQMQNAETFDIYYSYLCNLAVSMFEWEGLPPSVDQRYLEMMLMYEGYVCFVKDKTLGYIVTQVALGGQINHYLMPTQYHANAPQLHRTYTIKNSVLILNNDLMIPTSWYLRMYAEDLQICKRTIDVNLSAQMTPITIITDDNKRLTWENAYKQIEQGVPVIIAGKNLTLDDIKVLKTDAPFVADKVQLQKHQLWREVMTLLGIDNANMDKKERVQSAEVLANNGQVMASRYIWLKARQDACKKINAMYPDLNVSVKFRDVRVDMFGEEIGGNENG